MGITTDAVVIGSGPNGLAAAIVLAQAGLGVTLFEAEPTIGGGVRSAELTLPGFTHDVCSSVYPFAASPIFRTLPLASYGLEWVEPPAMLAHPFDDGTARVVVRSVEQTAQQFRHDRRAYEHTIGAVVTSWNDLEENLLGPPMLPRHPLALARFGVDALQSADGFAWRRFTDSKTRALFAGLAAHSMVPLDHAATAAFGLVLGATMHIGGWVIARGGSQRLSDALAAHARSLGCEIVTDRPIASLDELPSSKVVLCDLSPRPFLRVAGHKLPPAYRRKLEAYRYQTAAFKVDWALSQPIPWRIPACARAATVHLGGMLEEISRSERESWSGTAPEYPFVLLVQPTLFDPSRAPAGHHTVWTYCHVPNGSTVDMTSRIEQQIERFAPGFQECVLHRAVMTPADIERRNANYAGGDIGAGASDIWQLFTRPTLSNYRTPIPGVFLCSASTPPGPGVHGMCGYHAAQRALEYLNKAKRASR